MTNSLRQINIAVMLVLVSIGMAGPCLAAEANGSGSKMPQFNPNTYTPQLFWLVVAFGVAYLFFANKTLPEISSVLEKRHERIVSNRETAEKLSREAEDVQKAYEESLASAREEAQRLMNESKQAVKEKAEQEYKTFREKYNQETQNLEERLIQAKKEAMQDINDIVAELATQSAEKIAELSLSKSEADRIVKNVVSQSTSNKAA